MGKLAENFKNAQRKLSVSNRIKRAIVGDEKFDKVLDTATPLGTSLEKARDATKAAEAQLQETKEEKVMPIADDESLTKARRRGQLRRKAQGRASTILGGDAETLG